MRSTRPRLALALLAAATVLLTVRTWIALDHRLPWGALGDPLVLRTNKLSGWLTAGTVLGRWSWGTVAANALWELLPAAFFAVGLSLWLCHAPPRRSRLLPLRRPAVPCLLLFAVASLISRFCFDAIPHVQDTIAQQLQAQIFASGRWYAPSPPDADRLANEFVIQDQGRWYAQYPPMQPALLALGILAGMPWVVNPLLSAVSGFFLYRAARRAYGHFTGAAALFLFCLSPLVWFMSGEWMNHGAMLFFVAAALWTLAPAYTRRPKPLSLGRVLVGGLCLGLAVSSRPLCGVAVALPMIVGALAAASSKPSRLISRALGLGGGLLLGAAPLLAFNAATTGSPLRSGYEARWESSGWGFGSSQWGPPHTLEAGLRHTLTNWDAMGKYLFEWPLPGLFLLLGVLALRRKTRMDAVLAGILASVTLAYLPYFYQDLCLGPRFLYVALPAFVILSVRGLQGFASLLSARRGLSLRSGLSLMARMVIVCAAAGLALNLPLLFRWYGSSFWGTNRLLTDAVRRQNVHQAVVFIQDYNHARRVRLTRLGVSWSTAHAAVTDLDERWIDRLIDTARELPAEQQGHSVERQLAAAINDPARPHRRKNLWWIDYQGPSSNVSLGFHANTPYPERQDVLYAVAMSPEENDALLRSYPNRTAWLYNYNQTTGDFTLRPLKRSAPRGHRGTEKTAQEGSTAETTSKDRVLPPVLPTPAPQALPEPRALSSEPRLPRRIRSLPGSPGPEAAGKARAARIDTSRPRC